MHNSVGERAGACDTDDMDAIPEKVSGSGKVAAAGYIGRIIDRIIGSVGCWRRTQSHLFILCIHGGRKEEEKRHRRQRMSGSNHQVSGKYINNSS